MELGGQRTGSSHDPIWRRRMGGWLLAAAALACVLAIVAFATGGFRVRFLGVPLSVRGGHRALLVAALLATAGVCLHDRVRGWVARTAVRTPPVWLAATAALAVLVVGLAFGTRAAGGSDVYGYVSQSLLWREHALREPLPPVAAAAPWPDAQRTFAPLGYRPGPDNTIVPTYAPGLPLLMAMFAAVFGAGAEYWVTPLCGGALVLLTYLVGARAFNPAIGISAALATASSPLVLFMTCWLLGDLPAATFWMLSLWLAVESRFAIGGGAAGAGLAAAVAILIRPNLVPLAAVPLMALYWMRAADPPARRVRSLLIYAVALLPGPAFIAWLYNELHGSPLRSGYGSTSDLFSFGFGLQNLRQFVEWSATCHGPFMLLFPLAIVAAFRLRASWRGRAVLLTLVALVWGCYLFYLPFEDWWYLRFLLPAVPAMFLLGSDAVWTIFSRLAPRRQQIALSVYTMLSVVYGLSEAQARNVVQIGRGEQRYAIAAQTVVDRLPSNAVFLAMQHSGSIRHHAGRITLRWDLLDEHWLDRAVDYLRTAGYEPYFLVEDWEILQARDRFKTQDAARVLEDQKHALEVVERAFAFRIP